MAVAVGQNGLYGNKFTTCVILDCQSLKALHRFRDTERAVVADTTCVRWTKLRTSSASRKQQARASDGAAGAAAPKCAPARRKAVRAPAHIPRPKKAKIKPKADGDGGGSGGGGGGGSKQAIADHMQPDSKSGDATQSAAAVTPSWRELLATALSDGTVCVVASTLLAE